MSVIGSTSGPSAVSFKNVGDSVAGRIVSFADYQVKDFNTGDPKVFEKSGDPVMGCAIVLEKTPGDAASQVTLYAEKPRMLKAISAAVRAQGASDIEAGADLAVTWTGMDGRAKAFSAAYARPEAEADAAA